jgi:hypothetical protein
MRPRTRLQEQPCHVYHVVANDAALQRHCIMLHKQIGKRNAPALVVVHMRRVSQFAVRAAKCNW